MPRLELSNFRIHCKRITTIFEDDRTLDDSDSVSVLADASTRDSNKPCINEDNAGDESLKLWPPAYDRHYHGWEVTTGLSEVGRRLVLLLYDVGFSTTVLGLDLDEDLEHPPLSTTTIAPPSEQTRALFICKVLATIAIEEQPYEVRFHLELQLKHGFEALSAYPRLPDDIKLFVQRRLFFHPGHNSNFDCEKDRAICETCTLVKILCSVDGYGIDLAPNQLMHRGDGYNCVSSSWAQV